MTVQEALAQDRARALLEEATKPPPEGTTLHYRRDALGAGLSLCGMVGQHHAAEVRNVTCRTCRTLLSAPAAPVRRRANGHALACMCAPCTVDRMRATGMVELVAVVLAQRFT